MKQNILRDRDEILKRDENIIVSAGAGAGKTALMIDKIIKQSQVDWHYKIAAITFTKKATNEIKQRLNIDSKGHFIGTIDGFVEREIIRIFINDAIGPGFSFDFVVNYDESKKFDEYDEGIKILKDTHELCCYKDKFKNFKFELGLKILKNSKVARQYLVAKYSHIYIDEYQDCDGEMHELFMYLKDVLNIKLFIIGDTKQSIYEWRGANSRLFEGIFGDDNNFTKCELIENFRCHKSISNLANLVQYINLDYIDCEVLNENVYMVKNLEENYFDNSQEVAILVRSNKEGKLLAGQFSSFTFIPKSPVDTLESFNKEIFIEICKFIKNKNYNEFHFMRFMNLPDNTNHKKIKSLLEDIRDVNDKNQLEEKVKELFIMLEINFYGSKEIEILWETISNEVYDKCYNGETYLKRILTIHSSKGLEFEEVVIFSKNYAGLYKGNDEKEHYVAVTRAKKKLTIVDNHFSYLKEVERRCKSIGKNLDDFIIEL